MPCRPGILSAILGSLLLPITVKAFNTPYFVRPNQRTYTNNNILRPVSVSSSLAVFMGAPTSSSTQQAQQQEQQEDSSAEAASADTTDIPNWFSLSLPVQSSGDDNNKEQHQQQQHCDEQISAILQKRAPWSEEQYQDALDLYNKFISCTDSYIAPGIHDALNCLDHAYRLYGPHLVICSFNGGKDAVVILQLMRAAHAHYYHQVMNNEETQSTSIVRPRVLYFEHCDEFPEVISYLHDCVNDYDLDMIAFGIGIKFNQGLEVLVRNNFPPHSPVPFPLAFVLGTRAGDPNAGSQGYFAPSSHYMPPFMRVNPILEWTYGQVWHFLRVFSLPYCVLYDQGYTSLGTTKDTLPCPALAVPGNSSSSSDRGGLPNYWPAYMLKDWSQERAGRIKKEKSDKSKKPMNDSSSRENNQKTTSNINDNNKSTNTPTDSVGPPLPLAPPPMVEGSVITSVSDLRATDPKELDPAIAAPPETSSSNRSIDGSSVNKTAEDLVEEPEQDDSQSCYSYASHQTVTQRTAGLLVIGDEILKGATADTNTLSAAKAFREHSVLLKRVVVVSDDQDDIVHEILAMQNDVDVIVTSGGVGPTHDDVTIKSVAAALNREMVLHEEMAKLLKEKMNKYGDLSDDVELTEAQRKMATLPSRSKLRYLSDDENDWPVLQCRNIFILPGVPEFFSNKIANVAEYLSSDELERSAVYKIVLSVDETKIVSILNKAVEEFPEVAFGSYPFVSHPEFKTVLTLEGRLRSPEHMTPRKSFSKVQMDHHVRLALDYLLTHLPSGSILRVEDDDGL